MIYVSSGTSGAIIRDNVGLDYSKHAVDFVLGFSGVSISRGYQNIKKIFLLSEYLPLNAICLNGIDNRQELAVLSAGKPVIQIRVAS